MDVNRAHGVAPVTNNSGGSGGREQPKKEQPAVLPEAEDGSGETDAFEIDGLAAEITPSAQRVLDTLAAEIEPLRRQLALAKEREGNLREDLARHSFLPVPGRREFIRELNHVLNHLGELTTMPSLVLLHVSNADEVRRKYGRDALDRMLVHVADAISRTLQPTDILSNLGGNDFAAILLGADSSLARKRAAGIVNALAKTPFNEQGMAITPVIMSGTAELSAGISAEAAIRAADCNRKL
ncbi:MAG: diguanylate cyclase [Rhodospirillales bacterium]